MGVATFAGRAFRLDPESVSWTYKVKAKDTPTVGGKVVQIYGTELGDMTVEGSFGTGGWQQQEAFLRQMKDIGTEQAEDGLKSNSTRQPLRFSYPPRGWDFMVYLKTYANPDGGRSVTHENRIINPRWRLVLFVLEDMSGIKTVAHNAYIARLAKGIGWRQTEFNAPLSGEWGEGLTGGIIPATPPQNTGVTSRGGTGTLPPAVAQWRPLVAKYFQQPALIEEALRVMACESSGNPNAVNPSSQASGLFQHLPKYWAERSAAAGVPGASIFNPEANIIVAAWLYRQRNNWSHWSCQP